VSANRTSCSSCVLEPSIVTVQQPSHEMNATNTSECMSPVAQSTRKLYFQDHVYAQSESGNKHELTPRKKALKRVVAKQRVALCRLRKKLKSSKTHQPDTSAAKSALNVKKNPFMRFFESQIRLHCRNKYGRRYAIHDKNFALSLFYASPKAYRLCSKVFCLPSVSMLRLWLRRVNVKPGFCDNVFNLLQRKAQGMPVSDRCCVLLLDEISLKRGLNYSKSADEIVGFEDFGNGDRTQKYANQALVLMARGLRSRWKQPLAYFLACNTSPAKKLKEIVSDTVVKLNGIGLTVVAVICDQGATNQQMFRLFGVTKEEPCVKLCGNNVFFMFDPPHLLKSVRNNLVKHDFEINGKLVRWQHVTDFYERDSKQLVKLAPKLSHRHINLPPFANMRVRLAAQVFSHSVFAGIHTHVALGAMPAEAIVTANFIGKMDNLFDCFNAGTFCGTKQYRRALTEGSKHWDLLTECKELMSSLKIVGTAVKAPCVDGWILTINSLIRLFQELREKHDFKFILTNRLNQDALENHFAVIRSRGGFRDNPNPMAFNATFKQVIVNHLLDVPKDANCKDDLSSFMLNL
jgi:DNA transposase THAP9